MMTGIFRSQIDAIQPLVVSQPDPLEIFPRAVAKEQQVRGEGVHHGPQGEGENPGPESLVPPAVAVAVELPPRVDVGPGGEGEVQGVGGQVLHVATKLELITFLVQRRLE